MSKTPPAPRVVVIVGASSGIGRAAARQFAARGDTVVLAARGGSGLAEAEAECVAAGAPRTLVVPTDVTDAAGVDALFASAVREFGRVDAVAVTAAVAAYGRMGELPPRVFERVMLVNVNGTLNVARSALAVFATQGGGRLVLTGSLLGRIATPYMGAYVASKWAVHGLVRVLQIEARSRPGVRISLVSPGGVDTPIYTQAATYVGRHGQPPPPVDSAEKVARAVVRAVDHPRREISVGRGNPLVRFGFTRLPAVFDLLVTPLMKLAGLSRQKTPATEGNLFTPSRPSGSPAP